MKSYDQSSQIKTEINYLYNQTFGEIVCGWFFKLPLFISVHSIIYAYKRKREPKEEDDQDKELQQ